MTANSSPTQPQKLLRKPAVLALTGIPKSSWERGVRLGYHPKPVKIGPRSVAWLASDIDAFIARLTTERDAA